MADSKKSGNKNELKNSSVKKGTTVQTKLTYSTQSSKKSETEKELKKPSVKKNKTAQTNLIGNYFKSAETDDTKKSSETAVKQAEKNDFYKNCFEAKIELCEGNKNCHEVKVNLKRKLEMSKQKEASIQESIVMCKKICKQKDDKIKSLEMEAERVRKNSNDTHSQHTHTDTTKSRILFETFKETFAENQLSVLRSIDKSPKGDSTFILNCVRYLYAHDLAKLTHKSVTGKSKKDEPKEPITPQKLNQIQTIYVERLSDLKIETAERDAREKKLEIMFIVP